MGAVRCKSQIGEDPEEEEEEEEDGEEQNQLQTNKRTSYLQISVCVWCQGRVDIHGGFENGDSW